jgi:hypothetical protein
MATQVRVPLGTLVSTGYRSPESGIWQAQTSPYETAPIAKHNVMPPYRGLAVNWMLIQYA